MVRLLPLLLTLILSSALIACGDDAETPDAGDLADEATLSSLDDAQSAALCDSLIADSPESCWVEENMFAFRIRTDADTQAACVDMLDSFNAEATVAEIKACFGAVDAEGCDLEAADACNAIMPENIRV